MALTCHEKLVYSREYAEYAASRNILLIPGIEAKIEGKDVVVLNPDQNIEKVRTFDEMREYKKLNPQIFVMAPHPYCPHPLWKGKRSLGRKLVENIDVFDGIEMTWFASTFMNSNAKAGEAAKKYNLPFIATADVHFFNFIHRYYVEIEA